ncbi:hypothetical protein [Faecalibacterium sp. OM04-11BH]|jgi:hypothetical protein|uniref:hypothetical protein n=1 Tax=Faecalibacterium sp. OM04-11BH TaxID=2292357 RepID=UPI000E4FA0C2|nr:hypothetical protein [Faecalibacterium sp. OM04-11BH]RHV51399.1 hypothetical protein DXB44_10360 [Faecalibacterium sp. OM04-11BH]
MKKIKRLVTLLLAGVLALAMLTGCDGQTNVDLSDQLAQKATEAYAKALGVKAEEVQLTEEAAAFNKATLDRIGEDGVLPIGKDEGEIDTPMLRFRNKEEKIKNNYYHSIVTLVPFGGERTPTGNGYRYSVTTLKAEQVNAILSGSLEGLNADYISQAKKFKIKGVGVSAKKLKDGTYCYVLTLDATNEPNT